MLKDWQSVCRRVHEAGLQTLRDCGKTPFVLEIYPPNSPEPIAWLEEQGLGPEGRDRLRLLNASFRMTNPAAVVMSSDTWQVSDKFWKHYGLDSVAYPEPRNTRYLEILNREYRGSMQYIPDELKSEALVTGVKGPSFMPVSIFTFYHHEKDKIVVDRTADMKRYYGVWNIIPDWWESVIQ